MTVFFPGIQTSILESRKIYCMIYGSIFALKNTQWNSASWHDINQSDPKGIFEIYKEMSSTHKISKFIKFCECLLLTMHNIRRILETTP